jgi:hypothetical protein
VSGEVDKLSMRPGQNRKRDLSLFARNGQVGEVVVRDRRMPKLDVVSALGQSLQMVLENPLTAAAGKIVPRCNSHLRKLTVCRKQFAVRRVLSCSIFFA